MNKTPLTAELIQYSNDIISGKIIACKKHRWACMRFLRDIDRQNRADFPFIFDEYKANRFFEFASLFRHIDGIVAGQPIVPDIIHKFIFGNIYGWIHADTGNRRFKKFYWQVARKNTKSEWLSIVALFELMALDEYGITKSQVYCVALDSEQAHIVYDYSIGMLEMSGLFEGKYTTSYGRLTHKKTKSVMRPLSKDTKKSGDGYNPQCGIIDEYHAHETAEAYEVIESGMGARPQPLLGIITTAGINLNAPCFTIEYQLVSKILNPDIEFVLDNYFGMICELDFNDSPEIVTIDGREIKPGDLIDDIKDEKCWIKANPIICSYPEGIKNLQDWAKEAFEVPEKMRNFLTKNMNHWINERVSGYMNMAEWHACEGIIPDLRGKSAYLGGDFSARNDLTSGTFEFPVDDLYYLVNHSFMPETTFAKKIKTDKVPYALWVKQGWITLTPGNVVDYRFVRKWFEDKAAEMGWTILEWCLDQWGTLQLAGMLQEDGNIVTEIRQGPKTLSEPTKDLRYQVKNKKVIHDGNPVLAWAMSNAVIDIVDRNENIILNKSKSTERIDPAAATVNAHVRAMICEDTCIYNSRGMRSL